MMTVTRDDPADTQATPAGAEIPVPKRADVLADFGRVAKVADEVTVNGYPPENLVPLSALARAKVDPDPEWTWRIAYVDPQGQPTDAWLTETLTWKGFHMAHDFGTQERAEQALALLDPGFAEVVPDPRR